MRSSLDIFQSAGSIAGLPEAPIHSKQIFGWCSECASDGSSGDSRMPSIRNKDASPIPALPLVICVCSPFDCSHSLEVQQFTPENTAMAPIFSKEQNPKPNGARSLWLLIVPDSSNQLQQGPLGSGRQSCAVIFSKLMLPGSTGSLFDSTRVRIP